MADQGKIIGYDPNTGKAVYETSAAATPASVPASGEVNASPAFNPPRITPARGTSYDQRNAPENIAMLKRNAPMIAGAVAAGLTGGASIPMQMAATGGAEAVGQGIKDSQWDMPASQRLENAAMAGLGGAAVTGAVGLAGAAASKVAPAMKEAAKDLWLKAAKIAKPTARGTQTMRMGGDLLAGKREIADTVLSEGAGTIGQGSVQKIHDVLSELDDQLTSIIDNSTKSVPRSALEDALIQKSIQIGPPGSVADAKALAALNNAYDIVSTLPKDIPVKLAQQKKQAIYKAWNYAAEAADSFTASADKTLGKAYRSEIASAEPAVSDVNASMSRVIPAAKAVEDAASRTANLSPVGLSTMLFGMVRNPVTGVAAIVNDPRVGSWTAQQLYKLGQSLPKGSLTPGNIVRVLQALHTSKDESK